MEHIVVGMDESSGAAEALRWAVHERQLRGARLSAVLAWTFIGQHQAVDGGVFQPDYNADKAAAVLDELVTRTVLDEQHHVERHTVCDLPARALLEASADADLLVLGARGLGGFRGLLLGSVSQQCVTHSQIPVALIRETPVRADPDGGERIVVGVDGSATADQALAWAAHETELRQATLVAVHAYEPAMGALLAVPDYVDGRDDAEQVLAAALGRVGGQPLRDHTEPIVAFGSATRALLAETERAALVVVGSRGLGGFRGLLLGSVGQHLARHAACPTVVIPHGWEPRHQA